MEGYWYEQTKQHNDTWREAPANRVYFTNKSESQKPQNKGYIQRNKVIVTLILNNNYQRKGSQITNIRVMHAKVQVVIRRLLKHIL